MAITIDPRPTVFGDRMIVTGSYGASDINIDLSSMLSSIDFAGANSSGTIATRDSTDTGASPPVSSLVFAPDVRIDGTTIRISAGEVAGGGDATAKAPEQAGTFIAIGRRS